MVFSSKPYALVFHQPKCSHWFWPEPIRGYPSSSVPGQPVDHDVVYTLFVGASLAFLQLYKNLGIGICWEKSGFDPKYKEQYLRMLVDTIQKRVYLSDSRLPDSKKWLVKVSFTSLHQWSLFVTSVNQKFTSFLIKPTFLLKIPSHVRLPPSIASILQLLILRLFPRIELKDLAAH